MRSHVRLVIGLAIGLVASLTTQSAQAQRQPAPGQKGWTSPAPLPPDTPYVVCFAEGTDPAYMEAVNSYVAMRNQAFFGADFLVNGRWSGTIGTVRTLTWSFVPDGLSIPGGAVSGEATAPSNLFATMDAAFASQGGRATWTNRFAQAFDRWHVLTGITYTRITVGGNEWDDGAAWGSGGAAGARGDVRIGMHNIDGASNVLAYNQFPSNGDMVLDSADSANWASGAANLNRFLRNVVAHEHGHGIGLLHTCPVSQTKLMEPFVSTAYDGPRQDDIRGVQYYYGDAFEPNNTAATATDLGTVIAGTPIVRGTQPNPINGTSDANATNLSIGYTPTGNDVDYFKFTLTAGLAMTITAQPVGTTYEATTQTQSCAATGTTLNALNQGNLKIELLDTNGTTVLGSADATAAGSTETLSNFLVGSAGTFFVRITCTNTLTAGSSAASGGLQQYKLTVNGTPTSACPSFTTNPLSQQACRNSTVQLTVAASGIPTPTLQWRKDGVPLLNGGHISGATTPTLQISSYAIADDGDYDCVATNNCGPVTSTAATVSQVTAIVIDGQPQSQTLPLGSPCTFSVVASNVTNFQWYKDGSPIPSANSNTYQIAAIGPGDAATYKCLLTSQCYLLYTDDATLTIGTACYANCDGSTTPPVLNVLDFSCFLNRFAANDPYANCDGSTTPPVLNVLDFSCFLNLFAAGCP